MLPRRSRSSSPTPKLIALILDPDRLPFLLKMEEKSCNKSFGGLQKVFTHPRADERFSKEVGCTMQFGVYLPPKALAGEKCPVLYFLSGLTCTEANCVQKGGFQGLAAEKGLIVVNPDTSPRGLNIPGEDDSWDFGTGAGFYVDATESTWATNYRMYTYVTKELRELVDASFPTDPSRVGITGHSMGGHGALICALKNPGLYKSASAFAPICNPINCPWGIKAFSGYLGPAKETWEAWDSCQLLAKYAGPNLPILADTGTADQFYKDGQLRPEALSEAASAVKSVSLENRMQEGYDHSYFTIATFMPDHIAFHAKHLQ